MDPHSKTPCCRVSLAEICSLYQKLFQIPTDIRHVQAAVDKVCGIRPQRGFCCSSKLLDVLVEVERQRWVKEQIYWDFQLLDFNRDSSLCLSDVKILLQKAHESQVTTLSWVDFLTQREETSNRVTWSELEAWLFKTSSSIRHGTDGISSHPSNAQISFHENDQLRYQGELMDESRRLKDQWDTGGLEVIVRAAEDTTNARGHLLINPMDLGEAVDHKYTALNEKLFCDMLHAHYGSQAWASMNNEQKVQNLSELKTLAEFGLERRSELVLSQLPGATHNFRDEKSCCSSEEPKKPWIAVQGLKELQRRLELERSNLTSNDEGQSDSILHTHQYLLLFAQKIKVKMECNFSAALLVVEPYWQQRFWDEKPVCLETCFEELAHIRLTIGQRMKQKLEKELLSSKKLSLEEEKLLSLLKRQEEARDLLFQLLQSCSHEELQEPSSSLLHGTEENIGAVKEVSETKVERNPLRQLFLLAMTVTKTCLLDDHEMVTWGDCAVRLLVQVQLKQELEMRELILQLSRGVDIDDQSGQQAKEPVLEGNDPVSYLIHLLQPITPKEQLSLEQINAELVSSLQCTCLHKELDNKNIKEAEMMVNIHKQEENKTLLSDNAATSITILDQQKKDDIHIKRPAEHSTKESAQEKIQRRETVMVSSMLKEHEKEQGRNSRKERNTQFETPVKGSGRGKSNTAKTMQNEECEDTTQKHVKQVPPDELASSVMEATENLIAGLMTLRARVEEAYMKRGTDRHSPSRPPGNKTGANSPEHLSSNVLEAAESLIVSLEALKEEIGHGAKFHRIEDSGESVMSQKDSQQQKATEVGSSADCENDTSSSSVGKNAENLEDLKKDDGSLGVQSICVPDPVTREISWELHPQCSQGCNHAKLWDFSEEMAGTSSYDVSATSEEDKRESLNCVLKCIDEKTKTPIPEPLAEKEEQATDIEHIPQASAEETETDCQTEGDQKMPYREDSSTTPKEGRPDPTGSILDSSSEDSSAEQGSADKLAMSFLEAAHNLIGELIPGKEEVGLSSMRRVVVILTDSENADFIVGQGEELPEVCGTISSLEESSGGESQGALSKDEEETDECSHVPGCSNKRASQELQDDCVLSDSHANLCQDCSEGEPSTMLLDVHRQPPCPDTVDAEPMTWHSQGCDGAGKSQCRKRADDKKANEKNSLTSIKEANSKVSSTVETATRSHSLPTNKEMEAHNIHDMEEMMGHEEQSKNTINPGQESDSGNNAMNVTTSERGDPLTQAGAGIEDIAMTDGGAESAAEKHYKEPGKDEETQTGVTMAANFYKCPSVHPGDIEQTNDGQYVSTGEDFMTNEEKADETHELQGPYQESPGTLVKSVLLSTQDLIGSLTSLKERLWKNDNMVTAQNTDNNKLLSPEDHRNEKGSAIHKESSNPSGHSLHCNSITGSTRDMLLNPSYVSAGSDDSAEQHEDPSVSREKTDSNPPKHDKENLPSDTETTAKEGASNNPKEKDSLSPYNREAEGMNVVNQRHWQKKWRSMYERQMDELRKCDDGPKQESSISKRITIQIIEKSKSESVCSKQRLRPPSPTTTVFPEPERQEEVNRTSSRHDEHKDGTQEKEGDSVTEDKTSRTEQNASTTCDTDSEQGPFKDLSISLLEATNTLIGRLASLKGGSGRSQGTEQNLQDVRDQGFDFEETDGAPVSPMVGTEDRNGNSDNRNGKRTSISPKTAEYYHAMNDESANSHPVQETSADGECGGGIQRKQETCEEKVESSEVVFSITSNLAIIQNSLNQGEHCHMQKDAQIEISAHSVETSHMSGNSETTQMQFKNNTKIFQDEMGPKVQLIKHQLIDSPRTSESITEQNMPKEVLSNTSYCLQVSHMQISSEQNICEMQNITSGNSMNGDPLKEAEKQLTETIHQEPDNKKGEQIGGPGMRDLGDVEALRSYVRNGVIKRKREDAEEREKEKQNKENKKESDEKNPDTLNKPRATTSSVTYQGMESQSASLHQVNQSPWVKFWEATQQTIAVAAVTTTQRSNFFGHMAQVPANGVLVRNEKPLSCPLNTPDDVHWKSPTLQDISETSHETQKQICSLPHGQAVLQREKVFIRLSLREQQEAMQRLKDLQREAELKCASDRRRQMLRFQERLSIAQNRKSELDLMDITQRISPQVSPEPSPEGEVERQKSAVKEHLEKVKRERTYIMQTRRDRNMTSFRELLDPVLTGKKREDSGSDLRGVEGL